MKYTYPFSGKYTSKDFSIDEVIATLSAQKVLIATGIEFIEKLDENFKVEKVEISVNNLQTGSLIWDLMVEIYGEYQENIGDEVVTAVETLTGIDIPVEYEPIVTLGTLAVTYIVARYAYERVTRAKGKQEPSVHISGDSNVVIQNIAQSINQSPEVVEAALEKAVPPSKRRALVSKAADFLRPARKEKGASIELENAPTIQPEAIQEFPNDSDLKLIDESANLDVEGADIEIRALDRDKAKSGWSAMILNDERFPRRLPMDLYPTVDAEKLAEHRFVKGNTIVECEQKPDGSVKPKRIHLLSYEVSKGD